MYEHLFFSLTNNNFLYILYRKKSCTFAPQKFKKCPYHNEAQRSTLTQKGTDFSETLRLGFCTAGMP